MPTSYNKLTPFFYVGLGWWKCKCECGEEVVADMNDLVNGEVTACQNCMGWFKDDLPTVGIVKEDFEFPPMETEKAKLAAIRRKGVHRGTDWIARCIALVALLVASVVGYLYWIE